METNQANNMARVTTRDLIILIIVFLLSLPYVGFRLGAWWNAEKSALIAQHTPCNLSKVPLRSDHPVK